MIEANRIMALLNNPIGWFKFEEFKNALHSIDTKKIVDLLEVWGTKYFKKDVKKYLDEIRRFLAKIVQEIGERL